MANQGKKSKVKSTSVTLSPLVLRDARLLAEREYRGNFSALVEDCLRRRLADEAAAIYLVSKPPYSPAMVEQMIRQLMRGAKSSEPGKAETQIDDKPDPKGPGSEWN